MSRVELGLMQELRRLSVRIPGFVLAFANHDLTVDAEIAFVHQLANMADGLLRHANGRRGLMTDGRSMPLVIDMPFARLEMEARNWEHPPERKSGESGL